MFQGYILTSLDKKVVKITYKTLFETICPGNRKKKYVQDHKPPIGVTICVSGAKERQISGQILKHKWTDRQEKTNYHVACGFHLSMEGRYTMTLINVFTICTQKKRKYQDFFLSKKISITIKQGFSHSPCATSLNKGRRSRHMALFQNLNFRMCFGGLGIQINNSFDMGL